MGIQNNNRSPLLTIAIPTYNRRTYIGELLPELVRQAESVDREIRELEIVISDNASSDGTEQYIKETVANKRVSYYRNQNNIGGDRNFLKCIERAQGKYVWLVGDDDILLPGALEKVFAILKGSSPALCIVGDGKYGGFKESLVFDDYGGFLSFMLSKQPHYIIAHTLITSNIFLKSVFDIPKARSLLHTFYGHMYGLTPSLKGAGKVYVSNEEVFNVREQRAAVIQHIQFLILRQARYLYSLGKIYGLRAARTYAISYGLHGFKGDVMVELKRFLMSVGLYERLRQEKETCPK